jgi:hypothetical protein
MFVSELFIFCFQSFEFSYNLQALLLVTSHTFEIVIFETLNFYNFFLLVNIIVPFLALSVSFLACFELFPIFV